MLYAAVGAFIGALFTLLISIWIEYQRNPKLHLEIGYLKQYDYENQSKKNGFFLRVKLCNRGMPKAFKWLGRNAAMHCYGNIDFYSMANEMKLIFGRSMPIRWSKSDLPYSDWGFDQAKYNASYYRNCFPGEEELIDVVGRFDKDKMCYGWCSESYLPGKEWGNLDWRIEAESCLVKVTVLSAGEKIIKVFKLFNNENVFELKIPEFTKQIIKKLPSPPTYDYEQGCPGRPPQHPRK